jgi:hypothetical protein
VLTAFATFARDTQLCPDIGHLGITITANIAYLLIGNLAAYAYVHVFSSVSRSVNANENDCQQQ